MDNDLEEVRKAFDLDNGDSGKCQDDSKMEELVKRFSDHVPEDCCDSCEMPRYRSHKDVWALKIKSIVRDGEGENRETDGSAMITPEEEGYAPFKVDFEYMHKHKPQIGGYYVVYKDGYKSFSPAEAFESGYSLKKRNSNQLSFGEAIDALKKGLRVAREGWNGKGMYLKLIQGYPVNGHLNPAMRRNHDDGRADDVEPAMHNLPDFYPDGSPNVPQGKPGQMLSHIVMKTAGDSAYWGKGYSDYVPWLASQTDILAEDWLIVD